VLHDKQKPSAKKKLISHSHEQSCPVQWELGGKTFVQRIHSPWLSEVTTSACPRQVGILLPREQLVGQRTQSG